MYSLFKKAIEKRSSLLVSGKTNSMRLFDGAGDGASGIYLDQLGDYWLLSTLSGELDSELVESLKRFHKTVYWKKLDQHEKDAPILLCGDPAPETFIGKENGIDYELSFQSGHSQGLFLDQRENRMRLTERLQPGQRILNTFAYTGGFSVVGASVGVITTTLDLSQPYLDWAKRNMSLNDLNPNEHYFCKGDTFQWLRRFAKSGRTFDGVILDPPTFSRDAKGKVFRVEQDYHRLIRLASGVLSPNGWILACTNCRKLSEWQFEEQIKRGLTTPASLTAYQMPLEYSEDQYLKSYLIEI